MEFSDEPLRTGPYVIHYPGGGPCLEGGWLNGQPHGWTRTFYLNGQVMTEGLFLAGEKIGVWKEYDERGAVVAETNHGGMA